MKYKKNIFFLTLIIYVLTLSIYSINHKDDEIYDEVENYLKDKYNEEFNIELTSKKSNYIKDEETELENSYIYTFKVKSKRLIEFEVKYVVYNDKEIYEKNKDKTIIEPGFYDGYLYKYKINEIRKEIKNALLNIYDKSSKVSVSLENISLDEESILYKYTNDKLTRKKIVDKYNNTNKKIDNIEFFKLYKDVSMNENLIINLNIDDIVEISNLDEFEDEVSKSIEYIKSIGYEDYDFNYEFKNYESARATKYKNNKIYLIFDYAIYSDIDDSLKLNVEIF